MATWDSFNSSIASTTSIFNHTDLLWQINQSRSSVIISSDDQTISFSGRLLNILSVTQSEDSGNYSLQSFEGASEEAVVPQTEHKNSTDKPQGSNKEKTIYYMNNGVHPSTFFIVTVDCRSQSIDHSNMAEWVKLADATASQYKVPNYI